MRAHLPGLPSGEAFPAFRNPGAKAINISVPGLVFKAGLFGVPGKGFSARPMPRRLVLLGTAALDVHWPMDWPMDPRVRAVLNGLPQTATIVLAILALRRRLEPEPSTLSV